MDKFPRKIEQLLDQARGAHDPSADDRQRLYGAIATGLASAPAAGGAADGAAATQVGAGANASATATTLGAGVIAKWLAVVAVIAGVGFMFSLDSGQTPADKVPGSPETDALGAAVSTPTVPPPQTPTAQPSARQLQAAAQDSAHEVATVPGEQASPVALAGDTTPVARAADRGRVKGDAVAGPRKRERRAAQTSRVDLDTPVPEPDLEQAEAAEPELVEQQPPGLAAELGLIRAATRALRDRQPRVALQHLQEHRFRFPRGLLAQERGGLQALSLCELGRLAEGRLAKRRFLQQAGDSPMAARVKAACGRADPR